MVENTRFIPKIAEHFNVTPDYVNGIFKAAESSGSMIWIQVIIIVFVLSLIASGICIYFISKEFQNKPDMLFIFCILSVVFVFIFGVIGYMIGLCIINMTNPEYGMYMEYCNNVLRIGVY